MHDYEYFKKRIDIIIQRGIRMRRLSTFAFTVDEATETRVIVEFNVKRVRRLSN